MDTTATAAALAAVSGLAAYINGKYHIVKDLKGLRAKNEAAKYYAKLGMSSTLIPRYNYDLSC